MHVEGELAIGTLWLSHMSGPFLTSLFCSHWSRIVGVVYGGLGCW